MPKDSFNLSKTEEMVTRRFVLQHLIFIVKIPVVFALIKRVNNKYHSFKGIISDPDDCLIGGGGRGGALI